MKKILLPLIISLLIFSNFTAQNKSAITVDDLWALKRLSSFDVSPDGKLIVFDFTEYEMEKNSGQSDIWIANSDGTDPRPLKNSLKSESEPLFTFDGNYVTYIYKNQIWLCDLEGNNNQKLTDLHTGASGIEWSNDGKRMIFVSKVYPDCTTQECNKEKDEAKKNNPVKAKIFTELMYKHWNNWRGDKRSHLFFMDMKKFNVYDLTINKTFDVPPLSLGSSNDYSFSPDGKEVAFAANTSDFIATSTNNDIFIVNTENLKKQIEVPFTKISVSKGNDNQPVYSPDEKYIAFRSMERAGFEADKQRLTLYDRESGELTDVSGKHDISIGEFVWSGDSKFIYYIAANEIYESIYKIEISTGENTLLKKELTASGLTIDPENELLYFKNQRSTFPNEIFSMKTDGTDLTQITFLNQERLKNIEMNEVETFWSEGAEGAMVQSIILKPPFFDESKKYPLIFLIHGGPQGHWEDDFHFRWNLQMFASNGYVVVAPNPRGSVGYGQKFTDEISKDWGGKVYTDLMNAYDHTLKNYNFIDGANTFAAGASYGGYMINWIQGHNENFNALVSHAGLFNITSMYGVTEELWFPEWEFGGAPWENRELYDKWSPHKYVENFKTPMLVIHGAYDFRVPEGQAFELFTALQKMGVDSKLLYYPNENHFITKPLNAKLWWNSIFEWYEKYKVDNKSENL
jgi:dipeptidyl aminopeptidase/acylaminoacyl peptidase